MTDSVMSAGPPSATDRPLGNPLGSQPTRVLLLGSGELGREICISLIRLGAWVCAVDSYQDAPAAQVAQSSKVLPMTDPEALRALITEIRPDLIVPEVEAIATDQLEWAAKQGIQVVPSSGLAAMCMDREALRTFAHDTVGLDTTPYRFAQNPDQLRLGAEQVGLPCIVKPVMSSSGHGQTMVRTWQDLDEAWRVAQTDSRAGGHEGRPCRVIVEALAPLAHELTVLTVSSSAGIATCEPIGQCQEDGDYRQSWQPAGLDQAILDGATSMARRLVLAMTDLARKHGETGWGVYGVEIFVLKDSRILFNEVSPRPHDTGMVTMISQRLSEFDLHARAILGIPVLQEDLGLVLPPGWSAASQAVLTRGEGEVTFTGVPRVLSEPGTDLRIFAKPEVHGQRRMAVALAQGPDQDEARRKTDQMAQGLHVRVGKG